MGGATLLDMNKKQPSDFISVRVYVHGVTWSKHRWRKLTKVWQTGNQSDRKSE